MANNERDNGQADVVWQLNGDAMRPTSAPWGFIARNPFQRVVPPGGKVTIDLQVTGNVPFMAFPTRAHAADAQVSGREGPVVVPPGTSVSVVVENKSASSPLVIDDGEGLVCLHPLLYSGTSAVG